MRLRSPTLMALTCAVSLPAQNWNEAGDAGDTSFTANVPLGNGPLTSISGTLALDDADLYLIKVDDPAGFSCSSLGGATFDTQLWIFDRLGNGIAFRDDDPNVLQSTLSGQFLSGKGHVVIGISQWDKDALDENGNELWLDQPYETERQPDGPGAGSPVTQWDATTTGGGAYTLTLTGATFAGSAQQQDPDVAWAWVSPQSFPGQVTFTADTRWQHTPTGEAVRVVRLATGLFQVIFPSSLDPFEATFEASSYSGNHATMIDSWGALNGKLRCYIRVFDLAGNPLDGEFTVRYRSKGKPTERAGFAWCDDATNPQYVPATNYSWNGNRADPSVTRFGAGLYRVRFPGLGAAFNGGTFGATAYGTVPARAKVDSWGVPTGTTDLDIFVRCFDLAGSPVDSRFVVNFQETPGVASPAYGSGSYIWAEDELAPSQTGASGYTRSNGTFGPNNAHLVTRVTTGRYQVDLPSVAWQDASTATVVGRDDGNGYATIDGWSPLGSGTRINIRTFDGNGSPADHEFILNYNTNRPAGAMGNNSIIGSGCGGLTLTPDTRPVIGSDWEVSLTTVPGGSVIGFVSIGFFNPNFPLAVIGAPGCFAYQNQIALFTVPLPAASPSYSLTLPVDPSLNGTVVYAQGGVILPGSNALSLLTSNGVEGVVGDV